MISNSNSNHLALQTGILLELLLERTAGKKLQSKSKESKLISRINKFLHSHTDECSGVKAVADHLAMNERTLRKRFSDSYGINLGDYIQDFKLNRAKQLLTHSTMPVYNIALECGFSSSPSFCRAFKTQTGISPKQYRNGAD